eukprot:9479704-Pyramimonas_sp.AAC.1
MLDQVLSKFCQKAASGSLYKEVKLNDAAHVAHKPPYPSEALNDPSVADAWTCRAAYNATGQIRTDDRVLFPWEGQTRLGRIIYFVQGRRCDSDLFWAHVQLHEHVGGGAARQARGGSTKLLVPLATVRAVTRLARGN